MALFILCSMHEMRSINANTSLHFQNTPLTLCSLNLLHHIFKIFSASEIWKFDRQVYVTAYYQHLARPNSRSKYLIVVSRLNNIGRSKGFQADRVWTSMTWTAGHAPETEFLYCKTNQVLQYKKWHHIGVIWCAAIVWEVVLCQPSARGEDCMTSWLYAVAVIFSM